MIEIPDSVEQLNSAELRKISGEFREQGDIENYLKTLKQLHHLEPDNIEHITEIIATLQDINQKSDIFYFIDKGLKIDPAHTKLLGLKTALIDEGKTQNLAFSYTSTDINRYLMLFQGREGVHARQQRDRQGKWIYIPVNSPIDSTLVSEHFDGELTLGLYFIRQDNTVLVGCIDIDIAKKVLESYDEEKTADIRTRMEVYTRQIAALCQRLNIPILTENSGNKGYHLWFFFAGGISAKTVKDFLKALIDNAGQPPEGVNCEVFPKQDKVHPGGLGNLVKLPLGIHRKTGRRAVLVDPQTLLPYSDQIAQLYSIENLDEIRVNELRQSFLGIIGQNIARQSMAISDYSEAICSLTANCKVISYLAEKAVNERHLTHAERVVLLYTVTFVADDGPRFLHDIMKHCTDYKPEITDNYLKSRHANAMSCPKVRSWIPEITRKIPCSCFFEDKPGDYPHPLRHISYKKEIQPSDLLATFREYYSLGQKIRTLLEKRKNCEEKLNEFFDTNSLQQVKTSAGMISKETANGKSRYTLTIIAEE